MDHRQHEELPQLQEPHREEPGVQPHDLSKARWRLRARVLLAVPRSVAGTRQRHGWLLQVQQGASSPTQTWLRRAPGFIHACAHPVLSVVQYEMDKAAGRTNDEDSTRKKAKTTLDKYIHYFDRYINHDRARKIAIRSLPDIEMNMAKLQSACGYKLSDVTFIRGACGPGRLGVCSVRVLTCCHGAVQSGVNACRGGGASHQVPAGAEVHLRSWLLPDKHP